jgi:hypothetical protein
MRQIQHCEMAMDWVCDYYTVSENAAHFEFLADATLVA